MSLVLTDEQEAIRGAAMDFVARLAPVAHLRALRDAGDPLGYSRELWAQMGTQGLPGIAYPEDYGGAGQGFAELGLVMEACGRNLVPSPLFATAALAGAVLLAAGSEAQRARWLPGVCAGRAVLALAHEEGRRHAPWEVATRAERRDGGYVLTGEKVFVLDGYGADALVVVARTAGEAGDREGLSLFLLERERAGVEVERMHLVDSRNAARVRLRAVRAGPGDLVGAAGEGGAVLEPVLDGARVALAAEMLGSTEACFERTLAYLKTRRQFGVPIGSFQALKHRAAQMFCEVELLRSLVLEALRALDARRQDVPELASAAKARAAEVFVHVANEAVQMHGGVGVTDELDIGLYLKRARVTEMTLGTASFHRDRFARLRGY